MNERETIELLEKGKVAWNQWAQDLLSQKAALEASGRWLMSFSTDGPKTYSTETTDWFAKALVDLQDHVFDKDADFSDLLFPGFTRFEGAQFRGSANFRRTRFVHFVRFMGATFREADFTGAEFVEAANFIDAKFLESAQFIDTRFAGRPAWFSRSEFRGLRFVPKSHIRWMGRAI